MVKTFWLLEDDDMTQMVVSSYVLKFMQQNYTLKVVASAKDIKAQPHDIILSDQQGVDLQYLNPNGAVVISMSGNKSLMVDIQKPFKAKELSLIIAQKTEAHKKVA
jgi:hypothetical protein